MSQSQCDNMRITHVPDAVMVFLGALGGILVALSIAFVGAVEKTIATSASIMLTIAADCAVRGQLPEMAPVSASACVVIAASIYAVS